MAEKTANYGLTKPLPSEFYDVNVPNTNMDIIDEELKKRAVLNAEGKILSEHLPDDVGSVKSVNGSTGEVVLYSYGTADLEAGVSKLENGKLYFVYE